MLIRILLSYIIGYLRVKVEGYYIERFINICKNNKIAIWKFKRNKEIELTFNVIIKDFKEVCRIAKKTKCKLKIENKNGIPFIFYRYKKRKIFLCMLIILVFLISLSSHFVWNVEIIVENNQNMENIIKDIENAGLKVGKRKSKIDKKQIINEVRLQRNDIAWMGIELKGTNAIVRLVKLNKKPEIIDESDYCNIISDKAGIITKISAQAGSSKVKVGDIVNIGDTLINGWMEGKYTGIRYVHAKGAIEAKVWHTKHKKILYNTTEMEETGNVENKYYMKINNFEINFNKRLSKFKFYDTIETERKLKLFSNFYLPISTIKITNKELEQIQKKYDFESAKNEGIEEIEKELNSEIVDKDKIVNKNINAYEMEDGIDVYVTYEVLENIGTNEKIVF